MKLRLAKVEDAAAVKACIDASYRHYLGRLEGLPRVFMRKKL